MTPQQMGDVRNRLFTYYICGCSKKSNHSCSSMIKQNGNVYKTIVIGNLEWMAKNLN
jgi:hypothetical protein